MLSFCFIPARDGSDLPGLKREEREAWSDSLPKIDFNGVERSVRCLRLIVIPVKTIQSFTASHLTGRWEKHMQGFCYSRLSFDQPHREGMELFNSSISSFLLFQQGGTN